MKPIINCPMCGRQGCGLHDDVLALVNVLDRCALVGAGLVLAAALALVMS